MYVFHVYGNGMEWSQQVPIKYNSHNYYKETGNDTIVCCTYHTHETNTNMQRGVQSFSFMVGKLY